MKQLVVCAVLFAAGGAVDGQTPPALTLVSHDVELLGENPRAGRYSKAANLTLVVRNETAQTITAWRVQAQFLDPFGDELFQIQLTSGTSSIASGATGNAVFQFEDNQFIDGEGYDKLASYTPSNITIRFSNVRVVH